GVDGHGAGRHPRRARDHPLPAVLDRLDAPVVEREVRLVMTAIEALDDGLLQLVDHLRPLPAHGVDAVDALVMNLYFELLGPAAIATQPGPDRRSVRPLHTGPFYAPARVAPGSGARAGGTRGLWRPRPDPGAAGAHAGQRLRPRHRVEGLQGALRRHPRAEARRGRHPGRPLVRGGAQARPRER